MFGKMVEVFVSSFVLEVNDICYLIHSGDCSSYKIGNNYKIYLYSHVKEDGTTLYGFNDLDQKDLFLNLISVKGVGPKTILKMFSNGNINEIKKAIVNNDIDYLKSFPKIGEKVARQILFDLKNKVGLGQVGNNFSEVILILKDLGYKEKDYKNILSNVDVDLEVELQVKQALKLLSK
jgi:Holliday junction DNA helicase RuvA